MSKFAPVENFTLASTHWHALLIGAAVVVAVVFGILVWQAIPKPPGPREMFRRRAKH